MRTALVTDSDLTCCGDLAEENIGCSPELVRQIMRHEGRVAFQPRPFWITTEADVEAAQAMPDLMKRDFTADRPGVKLVGDITHIHTFLVSLSVGVNTVRHVASVFSFSVVDQQNVTRGPGCGLAESSRLWAFKEFCPTA